MSNARSPGTLWPISADRICLALTPRSTIHASELDVWPASKAAETTRGLLRTVCGSDAFVVAHPTQHRGLNAVASWPPPALDRCPDCTRILGRRLPAAGGSHWQNLKPITPRRTP